MKKSILCVFSLVLILFSCNKDNEGNIDEPIIEEKYEEEAYFQSLKEEVFPPLFYVASGDFMGTGLRFIDRIGDNYETAYDSMLVLLKEKRPDVEIYEPGIKTYTLTTNYDLDDRSFIWIEFMSSKNIWQTVRILDTNGNSFDFYISQ